MPGVTTGRVVISLIVAIIAISVGIWTKIFGKLEFEGRCVSDPTISVVLDHESKTTPLQVDPCSCFSETYQEARSKFLELAKAVGATVHSIPIAADGDERYTMDIAIVKGSSSSASDGRLVVHTSGVHGIEGYAGSAIQLAWLEALLREKEQPASPSSPFTRFPTTILVHAINPWGMAHDRRVNENNVDLNRNALTEEGFQVAASRDPNLAHYQDFEHVFNPSANETFSFWYRLPQTLLGASSGLDIKSGIAHLKKAMVTGQYHQPKGIFYGGTRLQPSLLKLHETMERTVLPQVLSNSENEATTKPLVTWINVHTGLGTFGHDTLLHMDPSHPKAQDLIRAFPGANVPFMEEEEADAVKQGYELTIGALEDFVLRLFDDGNDKDDAWILTQEFGTLPSILVGRALILENRAYHGGGQEKVSSRGGILRHAFYPRTKTWRREILERGLVRLYQATRRRRRTQVTGQARV